MQFTNRWQVLSALTPFVACIFLALFSWIAIGAASLLLGPLTLDIQTLRALTLVACVSSLVYSVTGYVFRRAPFGPLIIAASTGLCTALLAVWSAAQQGISYSIPATAGLALLFTGLGWLITRRVRA